MRAATPLPGTLVMAAAPPQPLAPADRGNERGARSRAILIAHALGVASVAGLEGLSFGRLARDLAISKGNIVTLFGTKVRLQIAVLDAAVAGLEAAAVAAAAFPSRPVARLRALVDRWFELAEQCPFPGGPLLGAACSEYRARKGAVGDRVRFHRRSWDELHLALVREAQDVGELRSDLDAPSLVFEIVALQSAAVVAAAGGHPAAYRLARDCARARIAASLRHESDG